MSNIFHRHGDAENTALDHASDNPPPIPGVTGNDDEPKDLIVGRVGAILGNTGEETSHDPPLAAAQLRRNRGGRTIHDQR
jgi:hypothetical protein